MICHTADNIYTVYLTVEACVICSCVPLMSEVSILTANHPFVPQSKLKCHCRIEHLHCFENCRVHTEYHETCWQREGGEKKWSEERQGVPWQLFHTHIHKTCRRPGTSEATADKNAKKRDEMGITNRSCLWIAYI